MDLSELSADDLQRMAELQFHMLAETWAALHKSAPDRSIAKLRTSVDGVTVGAAIMAQGGGE